MEDNTATSGNTWGHAVFYAPDNINRYYRDADLNTGDDISADTLPPTAMGTYDATNWIKK